MVRRKLPKAELRRYIRDTPFTRDEVQKLWNRFNKMDADGTGQLNYLASLPSAFQYRTVLHCLCHTVCTEAPAHIVLPCLFRKRQE